MLALRSIWSQKKQYKEFIMLQYSMFYCTVDLGKHVKYIQMKNITLAKILMINGIAHLNKTVISTSTCPANLDEY